MTDTLVLWEDIKAGIYKTIEGVKTISKTKGFESIKIYCPSILIGGKDET
jgi:hypothetical protein